MITVTIVGTIVTFADNSTLGFQFGQMSLVGGVSFIGSLAWIPRRG